MLLKPGVNSYFFLGLWPSGTTRVKMVWAWWMFVTWPSSALKIARVSLQTRRKLTLFTLNTFFKVVIAPAKSSLRPVALKISFNTFELAMNASDGAKSADIDCISCCWVSCRDLPMLLNEPENYLKAAIGLANSVLLNFESCSGERSLASTGNGFGISRSEPYEALLDISSCSSWLTLSNTLLSLRAPSF